MENHAILPLEKEKIASFAWFIPCVEILSEKEEDDAEAVQDMALHIRNIRKRLLLTQEEFSRRINVPLATLRNWEQGKRRPTGAARALLKILSCSPETMRFLEQ